MHALLLTVFCLAAGVAIGLISLRTLREALRTGVMPARWQRYPRATRPAMYWTVMALHAALLLVFAPVCLAIGWVYLRRLVG